MIHINEWDIRNFDGYLQCSLDERVDIQSSLALYYATIKHKTKYDLPVNIMLQEDLYELEEAEEYEACKLYLDTIEHIEQFFDREIQ